MRDKVVFSAMTKRDAVIIRYRKYVDLDSVGHFSLSEDRE